MKFTQIFSSILLAATSTLAWANEPVEESTEEPTVERIIGVRVDSKGLHYQVYSGGCTYKDDFSVSVQQTSPMGLVLRRHKPDYCDANLPYGTIINYSWEELGLTPGAQAVIGNQLSTIFVR